MTLVVSVLVSACTTIDEPATWAPVGAGGVGGAGGQEPEPSKAFPYDGDCEVIRGGVLNRGATVPAWRAGQAPGSVVNYWVSLVDFPDAPEFWWRFDVFAVGFPDELRAVERPLGVGVNANLTTCVHCLVVQRDCDDAGTCSRAYFPLSGKATISQMAEAVGDAFVMELSQVELGHATVDDELNVQPRMGSPCYYFDRILVSGRTVEETLDCVDSVHCQLAEDAGNRRP